MKKKIKHHKWKKLNFIKISKQMYSKSKVDKGIYKKFFSRDHVIKNIDNISVCSRIYQKGLEDGYKRGYKVGWLQGSLSSSDFFLKNSDRCMHMQYADLLKKFQIAIRLFNSNFSKKLVKIVLKISKIVVNDIVLINKNFVIKKIEHLLQRSQYLFQKLQLHVHPDNYDIIKKKFKVLMNTYNWTIILNKKIDVHGCRIITQEGELDSTVSSFWNRTNDLANVVD